MPGCHRPPNMASTRSPTLKFLYCAEAGLKLHTEVLTNNIVANKTLEIDFTIVTRVWNDRDYIATNSKRVADFQMYLHAMRLSPHHPVT